ncbi:MAG: flagellin [Phycisphaerae bacterium]|nr:flagellin [Tepidisphaeraceae bacterium]
MSRINTNISSMAATRSLNKNQTDLSTRLQRLSTGLKINSGKDAPAGLIASETLRSEIAGIRQAMDNSQRAGNVINTAEGALSEVSALLLEVQSLTNEAANTGALSPDEIKANQLQVDAILNSVNRISNTTQFNGVKLLNGTLDYSTSGVVSTAIDNVQVNAAKMPDNGSIDIVVQVTGSAQLAELNLNASGVGASGVTIELAGNFGTEQLSFAASTANSAVVVAINQIKEATGVSATLSGAELKITSTAYGSRQFVSVKTISGTFLDGKDFGQDATVNINGQLASVDGLVASVRSDNLDIELSLDAALATDPSAGQTSFAITGGGARFQIGSEVNRQGQTHIGIGSVATSKLGDEVVGYMSSIASGGANSLVSGNTTQAQKVLSNAIRQVATLRGRLGAFQKNILETNRSSMSVALENVTASESAIRDADFAEETAKMTRAQILVQANTSVLAQANSSPQNVLSLLG